MEEREREEKREGGREGGGEGKEGEREKLIYPTPQTAGTDYTFTCPTRYATRGFVNNTAAPTWLYVFNHSLSFDGWGKNFSFCDGHSCEAHQPKPMLARVLTRVHAGDGQAEDTFLIGTFLLVLNMF